MQRFHIPQLGKDPESPFPDPDRSDHPEGLVAWGGDLDPRRILNGYRRGIFPWYEHGSPILWWSPHPRAVLLPGHWSPPRRLARTLRQRRFEVRLDHDFDAVIAACAGPRLNQTGTWITPSVRKAYRTLHEQGHVHSVEIVQDGELVGGLYGLAIGRIFFAESKFHRRRDASKIALAVMMRILETWDFLLADCQIWNPHLERLGVRLLSGEDFQAVLRKGIDMPGPVGDWGGRLEGVNLNDW